MSRSMFMLIEIVLAPLPTTLSSKVCRGFAAMTKPGSFVGVLVSGSSQVLAEAEFFGGEMVATCSELAFAVSPDVVWPGVFFETTLEELLF